MSAKIIDGKALAEKLRQECRHEVLKMNRSVGLAVILVGDNAASQVYVKNKIAACDQLGIKSFSYSLPENTTEEQLKELVVTLNADKNVDGILVQLPLPKHINEHNILLAIAPDKDVDGFLPENIGRLAMGLDCSKACTPWGCIELIKSTGIDICGKRAVIVGRSNIVGKPVALMLLSENATVTVCHSRTQNLSEITQNADILVAAVGVPKMITSDMVKPDAVVIDVGMNRLDGKLCGDVDFESVKAVAGYITPVPGGVGPMTITMLMKNTLQAAKRHGK